MDEEVLRKKLKEYQNICMDSPEIREMLDGEHTFSKRFDKRMKRLMWSRRNFGSDIRMGYVVRRAAVAAAVILSLFAVNHVSARIWGCSVWKLIYSTVDGGKGVQVEYERSKESGNGEPKAKYDIPQYVPEGFKQTLYDKTGKFFVNVEWQGKSDQQKIVYSRDLILDGEDAKFDVELDSIEKIRVAGLDVELFYKGDEMGLIWHDDKYSYMLDSYIMHKRELIMMMESIYVEPMAKHDIPQYVPKGFKQTLYDKTGKLFVDAEWQGTDKEQKILYSRTLIVENAVDIYDAEVDSRKKIRAAGLDVELCYKGDEMRLFWYDDKYSYFMQSLFMDEQELIRMMESIYQE